MTLYFQISQIQKKNPKRFTWINWRIFFSDFFSQPITLEVVTRVRKGLVFLHFAAFSAASRETELFCNQPFDLYQSLRLAMKSDMITRFSHFKNLEKHKNIVREELQGLKLQSWSWTHWSRLFLWSGLVTSMFVYFLFLPKKAI